MIIETNMNKLHGISGQQGQRSGKFVISAVTYQSAAFWARQRKCSHWLSANGTVHGPINSNSGFNKTLGF